MNKPPSSNQLLCAVGENLVCAQLMARGWPCVNLNNSINNFKGIDLYCQHGLESTDIIGIQIKTSAKSSFLVGLTNEEASDRALLNKKIIGPWIFVHIKTADPLDVDYYVVPRQAVIDIIHEAHQWYLYQWKRPATPSLKESPATIKLQWLQGWDDSSRESAIPFTNPHPGDIFRESWNKIWIQNDTSDDLST
ncbi:MAG: hypothetical protein K2L46_05490 [Paramuribaculum sp.]|nr:hypothetical protein [Paramuribaculum sp.]MDE6488716.1 hypothetical protein [Paramuribaculum sp.]